MTHQTEAPVIVEKKTCLAVQRGNEILGLFAGPDCDANAALFCAALSPQPPAPILPPEILAIAERLHTQDNRITQEPLFAVQQKRRVYGVHHDYCHNGEWVLDGESITLEECEDPPAGAQKVGYVDVWEFVTGCFTEQGCKDHIAINGHNLHQPRIYAYGSYRNAEFIALRKWLMSLPRASLTATAGSTP